MGGKWVRKYVERHQCDGPPQEEAMAASLGDQWQCDCGTLWMVQVSEDGSKYLKQQLWNMFVNSGGMF